MEASPMSDNMGLPHSHLLHGKTVSIIGGGPAGLTLARLLEMRGVEVRAFERDAGAGARTQGGSLDLHEQSGQLAMRRCGLADRFHALSRPEGQASFVYDKHGTLCASSNAEQEIESTPEIDRGELCDLLRSSLRDGTVSWGRRLVEVMAEGDASYRLIFEAGDPVTSDLVVGCDGAWSKVRAALSPLLPCYTGVTFIETRLANADERHPEVARLVGPGSAMSLGPHKGLLAQRNGDGSIRVYVALRQPEHWLRDSGLNAHDVPAMRAALLEHFADWSPRLVGMLSESDDSFLPWPLYAMPTESVLTGRAGMTVIGDAAHVMPPFLGAGANMAMLDAVQLSDHLTSDRFPDLAQALAAFEREMWARMTPIVERSVATQEILFAADAPAGLVGLMNSAAEEE
jgi:2-polyprenyl-6-methoxyphenol hydroxylase-like FAD-dependent oxidoreductase